MGYLLALALTAICLASATTHAQDGPMIMGWGVSKCGELLLDRPPTEPAAELNAQSIFTWVEGYFSGRNENLFNEHKPTKNLNSLTFDIYKQEAAIWKLCTSTPGRHLFDVADEIWKQLPENKIPE